MQHQLVSALGLVVVMFLAWLCSVHRSKFDYRAVIGGLILQFIFAIFILKTTLGQHAFMMAQKAVIGLIAMSEKGSIFVFGENYQEHFFAFKVLPMVIFISSLSYLLFHWGIIQRVVAAFAWVLQKAMNVSSAEGLVTAANIFYGQSEAPLFIKPYLKSMTMSELNTMMTAGMATIAGEVLAAYVGFGIPAGHLLAASLIAAPASIVISKLMHPETEAPSTRGSVKVGIESEHTNFLEAACVGAADGLKLALNIAAMLIAFIALVGLANVGVGAVGDLFGLTLSLEKIFGWAFSPLAFVIGVPWEECMMVGQLLGEKVVLNEFYAYVHLSKLKDAGVISERAIALSTYALCGFANFSSIAIQIGGIGTIEPLRKKDLSICAIRALIGGLLASLMTACIAGILI